MRIENRAVLLFTFVCFAAAAGLAGGSNAEETAPELDRPPWYLVVCEAPSDVGGRMMNAQMAISDGRALAERDVVLVSVGQVSMMSRDPRLNEVIFGDRSAPEASDWSDMLTLTRPCRSPADIGAVALIHLEYRIHHRWPGGAAVEEILKVIDRQTARQTATEP